jgi:hypothetical protein
MKYSKDSLLNSNETVSGQDLISPDRSFLCEMVENMSLEGQIEKTGDNIFKICVGLFG